MSADPWTWPTDRYAQTSLKVFERELGGPVYARWYRGREGGRSRYVVRKLNVTVRDRRKNVRPHLEQAALEAAKRAKSRWDEEQRSEAVAAPTWELIFTRYVGSDDLPRVARLWVNVLIDVSPLARSATIQHHVEKFGDERYKGKIDATGNPMATPQRMKSRRSAQEDVKWLKQVIRWASGKRPKRRPPVRKRSFDLPEPPDPPLLVTDPLDDYTPIAPEESKTLATSDKRLGRWLVEADDHAVNDHRSWLRELITLTEQTGRRIGSVRQLRIGDVDLDDVNDERPFGTITWQAEFDKVGKTWPDVPISQGAHEAITAQLSRLSELGYPTGSRAWLFPAVAMSRVAMTKETATNWLRWADRKLKDMKFNTKRWQSLRARFATRRKLEPRKEVAWAGGWKDTSTLERFYEKLEPEKVYDVVELAA